MNPLARVVLVILGGAVLLGWLFRDVHRAQTEIATLQSQVQELERRYQAEQLAKQAALQQLQKSQQEWQRLNAELTTLRVAYHQLQATYDQLQLEKAKLEDRLKAAEGLRRTQATLALLAPSTAQPLPGLTESGLILIAAGLGGSVVVWRRRGRSGTHPPVGSNPPIASGDIVAVTMTRDQVKAFLTWRRQSQRLSARAHPTADRTLS